MIILKDEIRLKVISNYKKIITSYQSSMEKEEAR